MYLDAVSNNYYIKTLKEFDASKYTSDYNWDLNTEKTNDNNSPIFPVYKAASYQDKKS
ncbi:MAG: hypothetical protein ACRCVW_02350 [Brevinema sp.]